MDQVPRFLLGPDLDLVHLPSGSRSVDEVRPRNRHNREMAAVTSSAGGQTRPGFTPRGANQIDPIRMLQ